MKNIILLLALIFSGCVYVKRDVGLTTYQYDKCEEYYDANGTYHKDCPSTFVTKGGELLKDTYILLRESIGNTTSQKEKKRCVCSKSCMRECSLAREKCIKKCCYEKK